MKKHWLIIALVVLAAEALFITYRWIAVDHIGTYDYQLSAVELGNGKYCVWWKFHDGSGGCMESTPFNTPEDAIAAYKKAKENRDFQRNMRVVKRPLEGDLDHVGSGHMVQP